MCFLTVKYRQLCFLHGARKQPSSFQVRIESSMSLEQQQQQHLGASRNAESQALPLTQNLADLYARSKLTSAG